jgi:hypothetical protein
LYREQPNLAPYCCNNAKQFLIALPQTPLRKVLCSQSTIAPKPLPNQPQILKHPHSMHQFPNDLTQPNPTNPPLNYFDCLLTNKNKLNPLPLQCQPHSCTWPPTTQSATLKAPSSQFCCNWRVETENLAREKGRTA